MRAAEAAARAGPARGRFYLAGLACGAAVALATSSVLLAAALLLPGLLAWLAERAPERPMARAMLLFGCAGALPSLAALWSGPGDLWTAVDAALDPHALARAWAAQAAGWLAAELLPVAGRLIADTTAARRVRLLRAERARLADEWSLEGEARAG